MFRVPLRISCRQWRPPGACRMLYISGYVECHLLTIIHWYHLILQSNANYKRLLLKTTITNYCLIVFNFNKATWFKFTMSCLCIILKLYILNVDSIFSEALQKRHGIIRFGSCLEFETRSEIIRRHSHGHEPAKCNTLSLNLIMIII